MLKLKYWVNVPHFSSTAFSFLGNTFKIKENHRDVKRWKGKRKQKSFLRLLLCLMNHITAVSRTTALKHPSLHTHRRPCVTIPLCSFWNQQLHIWEFLEPLCSHGNIEVAGLQLGSRGHSRSFQRAQPDEARGLYYIYWISLVFNRVCMSVCVYTTVTDLRTAPVRKLTFSVTRPSICSRSCRMVRGMINRNGGQRRSPLRKTLIGHKHIPICTLKQLAMLGSFPNVIPM